ncbi:hypothetical protein ABZ567_03360 [Streptomyces sp. NPDC016459]|uniref:hypothetical protein n=1 Tax=Streptomyces sp. NPDC016459 TaxID=3157190 RepID=UPI0033F194CE
MSIIASLPVLKGHGSTVLSAAPEGLLLERPSEELTIPGEAIARVRADGGSVAVELRAPAGTAPVVQRIDGADETAATAFADGVNSLLLDPEEEVDGAAMLVLRTLRTRRSRRALRRTKWYALGCLVTVVALSVIGGVAGGFVYPVAIVPIGAITAVALGRHLGGDVPSRLRARRRRVARPDDDRGARRERVLVTLGEVISSSYESIDRGRVPLHAMRYLG